MALFADIPADATISEIVPLATDPNMRIIRAGRKTLARLSAADVQTLKIKAGMAWTPALNKRADRLVQLNKAHKDALKMLARSGRSAAEVTERLNTKGYSSDISKKVVSELVEQGWINERDVAEAIITSTIRSVPAGRALVLQKLRSRKVRNSVAHEAAAGFAPDKELAAALGLAKSRLARLKNESSPTRLRRIGSLLARRGFDPDTIERVVDQLQLRPLDSD